MPARTRVLVVDDSASSRLLLRRTLERDPGLEVCCEAADGRGAMAAVDAFAPDVVLMDIMMANLDGLAATQQIMRKNPRPVLLVSELVGHDEHLHFRALQAGAMDIVRKPSASELACPSGWEPFCRRVRLMAEVPVVSRHGTERGETAASAPWMADTPTTPREIDLVCIGASTGGPTALLQLLTVIGTKLPWPVLVVQHIAPGFISGMASWLAEATRLDVRVAERGIVPTQGMVFLAPDGVHLELTERGALELSDRPVARGLRPSVDVLFDSVARSRLATRTLGVLLTGMGDDGARGLRRLREAGAWTIAQDRASSVVYGMPRAAVLLDAACEVLPLDRIGLRALTLGHGHRGRAG